MLTRIAGGIVIEDICDKLPRHKIKKYRKRTSEIQRIYIHHSGRLGAPGINGPINSTRYVTTQKDPTFPGAPYHYWIPWEPVYNHYQTETATRVTVEVCCTIYRLQPDEIRCWHTGGRANSHGIGVALQGNTSTIGLSDYQVECLEALIPWLFERYNLDLPSSLSYHAEAGKYGGRSKAACPGSEAIEWIEDYKVGISTDSDYEE